ncbi:MAG TPA: VOC family protein [Paracoccaceae bacterium]|nr:VOC family protein [Paracoccaceae bacterium]HMO72417.1 VOC family protein [Paracoccaceae bacterium]
MADTPPAPADMAITFLYVRDLAAAAAFYERVLRLPLAIDQGWSRIYALTPGLPAGQGAHLGLVDETRGMHRAQAGDKPVQVCLRVPDVAGWHRWCAGQGVMALSPLWTNRELRIAAFVFDDPEGYQIEVQSPLPPDA